VARDGERDQRKFLSETIGLLKKLPLRKLTGHQTFDLVSDVFMIGALWTALRADFTPDEKFYLAIACFFFMGYSFWVNRPIRRTRK